ERATAHLDVPVIIVTASKHDYAMGAQDLFERFESSFGSLPVLTPQLQARQPRDREPQEPHTIRSPPGKKTSTQTTAQTRERLRQIQERGQGVQTDSLARRSRGCGECGASCASPSLHQ